MKQFFSKYKFWVVQLAGWFIFASAGTIGPTSESGFLGKFQIFFNIFIAGLISTSLLRWYFKKAISLDKFRPKDIVKALVAILLTLILYLVISILLSVALTYLNSALGIEPLKIKTKIDFPAAASVIAMYFILMVWTVLYLGIKLFIRLNEQRLERVKLKASIKQAQLNTLKGQVNPQFMFNSLNNISGLMLEDVGASREMLTNLAELLRYSLTKNNVNEISLDGELEMVDHYMALMKIHYGDRLLYSKEIADSTLSLGVPPMLVQLMVENATRHGLNHLKDGGKIVLETAEKDNFLYITVTHDGTQKKNRELTLNNKRIKQRLRLLYGENADYWIQSKGTRTESVCRVGLKKDGNE